jgi:hypothetical protein
LLLEGGAPNYWLPFKLPCCLCDREPVESRRRVYDVAAGLAFSHALPLLALWIDNLCHSDLLIMERALAHKVGTTPTQLDPPTLKERDQIVALADSRKIDASAHAAPLSEHASHSH